MTTDLISGAFRLVNTLILVPWALLVFAPRWRGTDLVAHSALYPVAYGLIYLGAVAASLASPAAMDAGVDFTTMEGVAAIFSHPLGILAGWTHFLVFDLFVGAWEARDARRRGIAHWKLVPCLVFTFLAGPLGFLIYLAVRRKYALTEP